MIVKNTKKRVVDTFPMRDLQEIRKPPYINDFIEYRVITGYSLGTAQRRRKGNRQL